VGARRTFRLLDVGFGQGDMLRAIRKWANAREISAELVGVDQDPRSAAVARQATPKEMQIQFVTGDYREVKGAFDCIVSSLVAHHMTEGELIAFLRFMEDRASAGWLINDLHRRRVAQLLYGPMASLIRVDPIVRSDGLLSIARSFRPNDWLRIISEAGLPPGRARLLRYFPFRLCVEHLS
jgi:2-polyprenyl-3-methyl-5-hydroxy-6-metoxy-1,4-benzoquinol methylase